MSDRRSFLKRGGLLAAGLPLLAPAGRDTLAVQRAGDMAPHLAKCACIDLRAQILQDGIPAPHLCRVTHRTRFQISHHGPPGKAQHRGFPKPPRRELGEAPALGRGPERLRPQRGISPPGVDWIRLPAAGSVGTAS